MKVLTNNGIIDLQAFHPDDLEVVGVARALSKLVRFCGNFEFPMSVAQHCVIVSQVVKQMGGTAEQQLAALHHDDSESITGDISSPIKSLCLDFQDVEDSIMDMVDKMYGIDTRCKIVREADKQVGLAERDFHTAMVPGQARIMEDVGDRTLTFSVSTLAPWGENEALARFLDRHSALIKEINDEEDDPRQLPAHEDEGVLN